MNQQFIYQMQGGVGGGHDVFSWDLEDRTIPQKHFHLAKAYIDSSVTLFRAMMDDSRLATFSHAQAASFLFEHALELFLKGALQQAGREPGNTHDLTNLYGQFVKLYPGKSFKFTARINDVVKAQPDRPFEEWSRYPIDKDGNVWSGSNHFTLELWSEQMEAFRDDFTRLVPLIERRYKMGQ